MAEIVASWAAPAFSAFDPCCQSAVLVPCDDEAAAVAQVASGLRAVLPEADTFVCDNNSSGHAAEAARARPVADEAARRSGARAPGKERRRD